MKKDRICSEEHRKYLLGQRRRTAFVWAMRIAILLLFFALWELFAATGVIDSFISSSPSRIARTIRELWTENDLLMHIGITLYETLMGFAIATAAGTFGSGSKSIILMAVLITVIVTIITMMNGFLATDGNKILLLRSMGATKMQILRKLVIPGSVPTFISMLKINVGMAWIGSIMGEYLVSRAGLGYLIVYGGQVFKLDLVMAATLILCVLAAGMYALVALLEKLVIRYETND